MKKPIIYAHKGASSSAPENTMAAFRLAKAFGADGIELDVQLTRDSKLVVIHDEDIRRTSTGSGLVNRFTYDDLKEYSFGSSFSDDYADEKIPLLEDIIKFIKDEDMYLNIELKNNIIRYPNIEELTIDLIVKYDIADKTIISSFNHWSIASIKNINSKIKTGLLYSAGLYNPGGYAKLCNADAVHPYYYGMQPEIIENCHKYNVMVNAWTVDNNSDITNICKAGVDGIITNYPSRAVKCIKDFFK